MGLRKVLDKIEPEFHSGGKYEKWYALFEAVDTIFYRPSSVTKNGSHVRDAVDMKRIMILVWMCTFPAMFFGMYNIGFQANTAMDAMGVTAADSWRHGIIGSLTNYDASSIWDNMIYGAMYFLPVYLVTFVVGGFWEVLFASVRKHEVNEGFFVTSILFSLSLPATVPLWQVALGITFGVVLAKEVFGGTGKNFLNPALAGRAFLFFAYPASMSGDTVWTAVDGFSGATALSQLAADGVPGLTVAWSDAFFGFIQGSMGETSTLAILIGGGALLIMRIAAWRIVAGVMLGMVLTSGLLNFIGSDTNPMFATPWYWHLVLGGFAFGMMYMATDPVSASMTNRGKWFYGALIGLMVVLIRVVNPAYPEGMMLAILFANLFAPFIDHFVVQANIKRRIARNG
ncbi:MULTISPECIES: NADH:ubiquinone reductase (Na(+)-transporting) subunit B [Marinomonas]|uniref:Na(+)-translocating NADH-quinone reductase subunit B n=1 Tax=Marinomonas arctica TaxID=383750 RepID=A0A7H1J2B9_9GAMM|nr:MULTISPECIES: NADH:ubiquinone reductase (Na(+)-transporting) subunit B [Marinomonas]MCS7487845.1 Na(+)-translocating NADH-quinone reductase subunit B [Marinomonas sp. BSi20414]QNT04635.1 NADH:ubiquinone reductase (Na(+)-transporting) subunit B [Marinomonas arctica]GGN32621.1 Na(+)-translocating NADH-quinone reductase subunit B [Marinomonas arctica]